MCTRTSGRAICSFPEPTTARRRTQNLTMCLYPLTDISVGELATPVTNLTQLLLVSLVSIHLLVNTHARKQYRNLLNRLRTSESVLFRSFFFIIIVQFILSLCKC